MSEIRYDQVRDKWVVISTGRALRPTDLPVPSQGRQGLSSGGFCPFCSGNEQYTPPELEAVRPPGSAPNSPGWQVRTIPNKFSAFDLASPLGTVEDGINLRRTDFGTHEVVIETPEHGVEYHEHTPERITMVLKALRSRYVQLAADQRIKHIQIYKNKGLFAGASLRHSHMQIVAMPFPTEQWKGAVAYGSEKKSCLICDMIAGELQSGQRVVEDTEHFLIFCPYAARFSFETWVVPKVHSDSLGTITDAQIEDLAAITKRLTQALVDELGDPSYNLVFTTPPVNSTPNPSYHWYLEIFPRLIVQAGVELATGMYMNPISPEWAAETLSKRLRS